MKRKLGKQRHDLVRLCRNTQRKHENQIRLKIKELFESSQIRFSVDEKNTNEENA